MRFLLLLATFCFPAFVIAQPGTQRFFRNDYCRIADTCLFFTGSSNRSVLYIPRSPARDIRLNVRLPKDQYELTMRKAAGDTLFFEYTPYKTGSFVIDVVHNGTGRPLQTMKCMAADLVAPVAVIGNGRAKMPRNILIASGGLRVEFPGSLFRRKLVVTSYLFESDAENALSVSVKNNQLPPDIVDALKMLPAGSVVHFKEIVAKGPDCIPRKLNDISVCLL